MCGKHGDGYNRTAGSLPSALHHRILAAGGRPSTVLPLLEEAGHRCGQLQADVAQAQVAYLHCSAHTSVLCSVLVSLLCLSTLKPYSHKP